MKIRLLKILLIFETLFIVLWLLWGCFAFMTSKTTKITELLRETSPNGDYVLYIEELGEPDWPFGVDHLRVTLRENKESDTDRVSFEADVSNDGGRACCEIEWLEDGVQIALKGSEQPTAYYVLPFKTLDD